MSYCTKCGKQNPDTAKFCIGCGSILLATSQQQATNQTTGKNKWIPLSVLTAILLTAVVYFLFIHKGKTQISGVPSVADTTIIHPFIAKSFYKLPSELKYISKQEINEFGMGLNYPSLYPIGWSRDGKFAFTTSENPDTYNAYFFHVYIQDITTDKILWHWEFDVDDQDNNSEDQKGGFRTEDDNEVNRKKIWNWFNNLITAKMNEHQIEPIPFTALAKPPVVVNGNQAIFSLQNRTFNNLVNGFTEIIAAEIFLQVNGVEKKRIYNQKYAEGTDEYSGHSTNRIAGYFKSPFENKVAVVLLDTFVGWEKVSEMSITLIGCDLNNVGLY